MQSFGISFQSGELSLHLFSQLGGGDYLQCAVDRSHKQQKLTLFDLDLVSGGLVFGLQDKITYQFTML